MASDQRDTNEITCPNCGCRIRAACPQCGSPLKQEDMTMAEYHAAEEKRRANATLRQSIFSCLTAIILAFFALIALGIFIL